MSLTSTHYFHIYIPFSTPWASLVAQRLKHLPAMWETWVRSLGREDPLEKEMATHSSILAWRIPWTEEPGGLQSTGSQRVRHDWATSLHFTSLHFTFHPSAKVLKAFLQNFIELTKDDVIYLNNLTQTCAICQQTNPNSNIRPPPSPTHQIHGHLPAQDWQADFTHMPL